MSPLIRKSLFTVLTGAVAAYAVVNLSGPNGWSALLDKREAIGRYELSNQALEVRVKALEQRNRDIQEKKPEVIIPLVRESTNGVRKGEREFRLDRETPPAPPPAAK